ncbi:hypothetical protein RFW18_17155 [Metabacillus idriensis]|uniref:hypothetical protein n=1 Tax=Metabacillus idriensis TaxID=324768 RepID=UPI0028131420|nr:hypothetical protein [Metabacillus idriensis]MDR0139486.1 hypothetical protein [Metabacillus idriensis]
MDSILLTNLIRIGVPIIVIAASIFWTMKMSYTRRLIPPVALAILAAAVFLAPYILEWMNGSDRDFETVLLTIYITLTLMLSSVLSLITSLFVKKKETK